MFLATETNMKAEKNLSRESNAVELAPQLRQSFLLKRRISSDLNIQDFYKISYNHI